MSQSDDSQVSNPQGSSGGTPPPSDRADSLGAWVTAAALGAVFLLFYLEARTLPDDIQRWPRWLVITGVVLLVIYGLQQLALTRQWRVIEKLDELEEPDDDPGGGTPEPEADGSAEDADEGDEAEEAAASARDTTSYGNPDDYTRLGDIHTAGAALSFGLFALIAYGFGLLLAALLFVPAYMYASGERHIGKLVGLSIGTSIVVYLLFGFVLGAPLTRGEWIRTDWLIEWIPL